MALAAVFLLALLLAFREVSEVDLGFHLRAGQWMLEQGRWPQTDPFTYTVTDHPYIDLHWLYQLALVGLDRLGGSLTLVVAHAAGMLVAFALVAMLAWRHCRSPLILAALFLVGVLAAEMRFMVRPEVLSWIFLGLTVLIVERRAAGQSAPLWLLPVIHVLWVNSQGLFILGWFVLFCYLVGGWIEKGRLDRSLLLWGGASAVGCFLNPYLLQGVLFPWTLLTRLYKGNPFSQTISEFASPWHLNLSTTQPFYPRLALWSYYALVVGAVLVLLLTLRKHRVREYLLFGGFFLLSAQAVRNVPLFVLVALPIVAASLPELPATLANLRGRRYRRPARMAAGRRSIPWAKVGAVLLLLVIGGLAARVVTNAYYLADRRIERFGYRINPAVLPVHAVEFMRERGIEGRILNHLNYGGYLMWQWPGPLFIDGRLEVMGEEFYEEYLKASDEKDLLSLLDRYEAQVVIFPYLVANSWVQQLRASPQWRLAYFDTQSAIYLRAGSNPTVPAVAWPALTPDGLAVPVPAASQKEILYAPRSGGLAGWLEGFWRRQEFPQDALNRGTFHYYLDRLDAAEAFYLDALRSSQGRYLEVYNNLGAVYFKEKRYREAAFCYRTVLEEWPTFQLARERLQEIEGR